MYFSKKKKKINSNIKNKKPELYPKQKKTLIQGDYAFDCIQLIIICCCCSITGK